MAGRGRLRASCRFSWGSDQLAPFPFLFHQSFVSKYDQIKHCHKERTEYSTWRAKVLFARTPTQGSPYEGDLMNHLVIAVHQVGVNARKCQSERQLKRNDAAGASQNREPGLVADGPMVPLPWKQIPRVHKSKFNFLTRPMMKQKVVVQFRTAKTRKAYTSRTL